MKIGFIGLGIMGKPMAYNLLKAGHQLVVYDIVKDSMDKLAAAGAVSADSPKNVAESCMCIITMLPDSPQVQTVVLGEKGILKGAKAGSLLIDMSSIAPGASQEIASECEKAGVRMLDAPVSGGEPKAIDGSLSIMVGGNKALFESVKDDILLKMGASAVYCGEIGAGNTTKLANQIIVACNIAALAEALTLAKRAGVDPMQVYEAIKGGLAGSTVMNAKAPMMIKGEYKPGFRVELHIKDLANALETGRVLASPLPLTAIVMEMFQTLRDDGAGQDDHSALAKYYAKISGESIN
ncbi:MAG: 2-hydroxy-3-oxopropionate reductase [Clostridiaceae bacterium]|jgi:2-hydroxy-3-oxopropionate reductase|nr:2-hydroxy-3-oxopropionate reductase [Clostridiaceae bacterium]